MRANRLRKGKVIASNRGKGWTKEGRDIFTKGLGKREAATGNERSWKRL